MIDSPVNTDLIVCSTYCILNLNKCGQISAELTKKLSITKIVAIGTFSYRKLDKAMQRGCGSTFKLFLWL